MTAVKESMDFIIHYFMKISNMCMVPTWLRRWVFMYILMRILKVTVLGQRPEPLWSPWNNLSASAIIFADAYPLIREL
jgi:hypothetical protein